MTWLGAITIAESVLGVVVLLLAATYPKRLLPSEYFRRQVYTMFWFEQTTLGLLEKYPDNVMFETDFPHPTSLTPTPYTVGIPKPSDLISQSIDRYGEDLMRKVLETYSRLLPTRLPISTCFKPNSL